MPLLAPLHSEALSSVLTRNTTASEPSSPLTAMCGPKVVWGVNMGTGASAQGPSALGEVTCATQDSPPPSPITPAAPQATVTSAW